MPHFKRLLAQTRETRTRPGCTVRPVPPTAVALVGSRASECPTCQPSAFRRRTSGNTDIEGEKSKFDCHIQYSTGTWSASPPETACLLQIGRGFELELMSHIGDFEFYCETLDSRCQFEEARILALWWSQWASQPVGVCDLSDMTRKMELA